MEPVWFFFIQPKPASVSELGIDANSGLEASPFSTDFHYLGCHLGPIVYSSQSTVLILRSLRSVDYQTANLQGSLSHPNSIYHLSQYPGTSSLVVLLDSERLYPLLRTSLQGASQPVQ